MTLEDSVLKSRLLPDPHTVQLFLNKKYIYINGYSTKNPQLLLTLGDLIQLVISNWIVVYRSILFN